MTTALTEDVYELIRGPLFDGPPGQGAQAAKQKIADAIAANPLPLMLWLADAGVGIVEHVVFHTPDPARTVTITKTPCIYDGQYALADYGAGHRCPRCHGLLLAGEDGWVHA